jgi:hypothetical protein
MAAVNCLWAWDVTLPMVRKNTSNKSSLQAIPSSGCHLLPDWWGQMLRGTLWYDVYIYTYILFEVYIYVLIIVL